MGDFCVIICRLGACPGIDADPTNNNSLCFEQYELFQGMQKCGVASEVPHAANVMMMVHLSSQNTDTLSLIVIFKGMFNHNRSNYVSRFDLLKGYSQGPFERADQLFALPNLHCMFLYQQMPFELW